MEPVRQIDTENNLCGFPGFTYYLPELGLLVVVMHLPSLALASLPPLFLQAAPGFLCRLETWIRNVDYHYDTINASQWVLTDPRASLCMGLSEMCLLV